MRYSFNDPASAGRLIEQLAKQDGPIGMNVEMIFWNMLLTCLYGLVVAGRGDYES
jgi:hypothetical protein